MSALHYLARTRTNASLASRTAAPSPAPPCRSSFSQTVENFFDLAFIVKDGQTRIISEDGCAYLVRAKMATSDDFKAGLVKTQNILKLDVPTWKSLVAKWCTPELPTLLPSRAAGRGTGESERAAAASGGAGKRPRES